MRIRSIQKVVVFSFECIGSLYTSPLANDSLTDRLQAVWDRAKSGLTFNSFSISDWSGQRHTLLVAIRAEGSADTSARDGKTRIPKYR